MESLFLPLLKPNEKILWTGKPRQGLLIRDADMLAIPMSIMLFGFVLLMDYLMFTSPGLFTIATGILFSGLFVYLGVLRFFTAARRRRHIFYCITNRRVISVQGKKKQFSTLPLRNIQRAEVTAEKDGSGHITFGSVNPVWPWLFGTFYFSGEGIAGFELVPEVENVYRILTQQLQSLIEPSLRDELEPGAEELN